MLEKRCILEARQRWHSGCLLGQACGIALRGSFRHVRATLSLGTLYAGSFAMPGILRANLIQYNTYGPYHSRRPRPLHRHPPNPSFPPHLLARRRLW